MISTYIVCGSYLLFPLFPKPLPSIGQCEDGLRYCTIACKKKAASSTRCLCKCQFFERLQPISEIEGVLNPTHLHFSSCCQFPFLAKVPSLFLKKQSVTKLHSCTPWRWWWLLTFQVQSSRWLSKWCRISHPKEHLQLNWNFCSALL